MISQLFSNFACPSGLRTASRGPAVSEPLRVPQRSPNRFTSHSGYQPLRISHVLHILLKWV